ncbi:glycosyltransferase family 39 protein [Kutzneria kofuensis]|uniref:4-amino-4-deoxy-L-arabinose transferase-like glycosyltransferase n=1 Tax=Kutzneria kofuensis TaxID=103725 RepID=A0A7W9KF45_9PSEU|nr:glycosyltransferase family 39 protein [Kutzneria kofuensis]MBB5891480.1 4-amino-4-deoxy-L-arabinose transferase-like glycosyltransferase [Kutzneria kofuensis]
MYGGTTTIDRPAEAVAFATRPIAIIAGLLGIALLATSWRYGYFGDELYFVAAGHHLDFGYADQPPLVPFLALVADTVAPDSLVALRIPAMLVTVAGVFVAALTARELGGSRRAQIATAATYAVAPFLAGGGHLLATSTVDPFLWTVITWLLVRWVRLRDDKLLLWAGIVTAVTLQVKWLIVFFWLITGVAVSFTGPRDLLRSRMLWLGAVIAVLTSVPQLLWQARNGWPQLQMGSVIAADEQASIGGAGGFLLVLALYSGVVGVPLALFGLWRTLRLPRFRFLGVTAIGLIVVFIATGGRPYYAGGILPVLWAFGAVGLDGRRRWLPWVAWPAFAVSVALVVFSLPVRPVESLRDSDEYSDFIDFESVGWPEMADEVAVAYRALPDDVREHTAIVGDTYWSASAMAHYGPERGLPAPYSPNRGYWYFGVPPESATNVLYIGDGHIEQIRPHFGNVTRVATVDNKLGIQNGYQGAPIYLATNRDASWSTLWPALRNL